MLVKEVYTFFSHSLGIVYIGGNILKCKIFDIYHVCSKRTWKGNQVAKKYICGTSVEKQSYIFCDDLMPWADINKSDFVLQRSIMILRLIPVVFKFESTMILTSCHIKIVPFFYGLIMICCLLRDCYFDICRLPPLEHVATWAMPIGNFWFLIILIKCLISIQDCMHLINVFVFLYWSGHAYHRSLG